MEIERKFLVNKLPEDLKKFKSLSITQGYISFSPTIRLRKSNEDYFLTCKTKGHIERDEWEIQISKEDFNRLWKKIDGIPIEKTRYLIPIESGYMAELDIYYGLIEGLLTVEVEFETLEKAKEFIPPDWFGRDVSMESKYKNGSLSRLTEADTEFIKTLIHESR